MSEVEERFLIGLPKRSSFEEDVAEVTAVVKKFNGRYVSNITIPPLRVGTIDDLMLATDKLQSLFDKVQSLLAKLIQLAEKILHKKRSELSQDLLVSGRTINDYLKKFTWEVAKYPTHRTILYTASGIERQINQTADDMIRMTHEYFEVDEELQSLERQQECSLIHKDVSFLVKPEDFVLNSRYLMTALVVVHQTRYTEWLNCYERLDREVVPRSSALVYEEGEYGLFTVTLFKRHLDLFKERAKELRFDVKNFVFKPQEIEKKKRYLLVKRAQRGLLYVPLVKWLKANFSETYVALAHVQTMRLMAEGALRYGLPPQFFVALLGVPADEEDKLLNALRKHYEYVDQSLKYISQRYRKVDSNDLPFVVFKVPTDLAALK